MMLREQIVNMLTEIDKIKMEVVIRILSPLVQSRISKWGITGEAAHDAYGNAILYIAKICHHYDPRKSMPSTYFYKTIRNAISGYLLMYRTPLQLKKHNNEGKDSHADILSKGFGTMLDIPERRKTKFEFDDIEQLRHLVTKVHDGKLLVDYYWNGLNYRQIATKYNCSIEGARGRCLNAIERIRGEMC